MFYLKEEISDSNANRCLYLDPCMRLPIGLESLHVAIVAEMVKAVGTANVHGWIRRLSIVVIVETPNTCRHGSEVATSIMDRELPHVPLSSNPQ